MRHSYYYSIMGGGEGRGRWGGVIGQNTLIFGGVYFLVGGGGGGGY